MRIIPKTTKVKLTFYKGITVGDVVLGLIALALIAISLSSNFPFRGYLALGILCLTIPLYLPLGEKRLYIQIGYLAKYLFSRKSFAKEKTGGGNISAIVPYRDVVNGIVYCREGSLFGTIKVEPINFAMMSPESQDALIEGTMSTILDSLSGGEELFLTKTEEPLVLDKRIQEELKKIDAINKMKERGELSQKEANARIDVIQDRIVSLDEMNSAEVKRPAYYLSLLGCGEEKIEEKLARMESLLQGENIQTHRLGEEELKNFIAMGFDPDHDPREAPDSLPLPEKAVFHPLCEKQGENNVTHLVVSKYPLIVPNAWLEGIFSLENTKVTLRMKPVEKEKAIRRIDHAILETESKPYGKESKQMEDDAHIESLRDLLGDIQQGDQTLFDCVLILSVYDKGKETTNRRQVKQALHEMGFGYSEMIGRQLDAYVSSLISSKEMTGLGYGIQTETLASGFPSAGDILADESGLLIGENEEPCFLDFFKRDEVHVNSNMAVIGQSGSGKSFAVKSILASLASEGGRIFVLDPESEYRGLAKSLGGTVIDASNGERQRINPFEIVGGMEEDYPSSNAYYAQLQFLESFYKTILPDVSPEVLETLNRLTQSAYQEKGIGPNTVLSKLSHGDYPTFQDVYRLAKTGAEGNEDGFEKSWCAVAESYLSRFVEGGRDCGLWNGATTFSPESSFVAIDFQRLIANKNEVTANAQMLLILRYVENEVIQNRERNRKEKTNRKIVVCIDEAHLFIDERYPIALDFMYSLAKRIRKYDGMLIVITQNLRDFMGSPEIARKASALISVSQYSMIFSLSPNDLNELLKLYENSGGFNKEEKEAILHSRRGECYLLSSSEQRNLVTIQTGETTRKMFEE